MRRCQDFIDFYLRPRIILHDCFVPLKVPAICIITLYNIIISTFQSLQILFKQEKNLEASTFLLFSKKSTFARYQYHTFAVCTFLGDFQNFLICTQKNSIRSGFIFCNSKHLVKKDQSEDLTETLSWKTYSIPK